MTKLLYTYPALTFYLGTVISVVIMCIPFIGKFFRSLYTLLHESGHALVSMINGNEVVFVDLLPDTSGVALVKSKSRAGSVMVAMAGYILAALFTGILLYFWTIGRYNWIFFTLLTVALFNLMFFVRNLYGIVWLLIFSAILLWVVWQENEAVAQPAALLLCLIAFVESLAALWTMVSLSFRKPAKAGDVTVLARLTGWKAENWGTFLFVLLLGIALATMYITFPPLSQLSHEIKSLL